MNSLLVDATLASRHGYLSRPGELVLVVNSVRAESRDDAMGHTGLHQPPYADASILLASRGILRRFLGGRSRHNRRYAVVAPTQYSCVANVLESIREDLSTVCAMDESAEAVAQALKSVAVVHRMHRERDRDGIEAAWPDMSTWIRADIAMVLASSMPWMPEISAPVHLHAARVWSQALGQDRLMRAAYAATFLRGCIRLWHPAVRARILMTAGMLSDSPRWPDFSSLVGIAGRSRFRSTLKQAEMIDPTALQKAAGPILEAFASHTRLDDVRGAINPTRSVLCRYDAPTSYYLHSMVDEDAQRIVNGAPGLDSAS